MSPILKPYGHQLGANLLPNGRHLGAKSGRSWSQLVLGRCWPKLTPSRANVVARSDRNEAFGWFCADLQNVQIITVPSVENAPQLKLHHPDRLVRSNPLLNYHASAPSVRADLYQLCIWILYVYVYVNVYVHVNMHVYVYICVYAVYVYKCKCVYIYIESMYICIYIYKCIHVYMYTVYMYICIYAYMYLCIYKYICIYIYICICMCICAYICIYIYTYLEIYTHK